MSDRKPIDIARRLAELGQIQDAFRAYELAVHENEGKDPAIEMEAAIYTLQFGGDYRKAYTSFYDLYNRGQFREECFAIMTEAFYDPNKEELEARYKENCALLAEYPHLPRKDFIPFGELPIRFYPFDDTGYIPFYPGEGRFGEYTDFSRPVIAPNFLYDISKPITVSGVFSQEDMNWLCSNTPGDKTVYLRYADWGVFCSHLQVLDLRPVLEGGKVMFLFGSDRAME